ncbi:MAG: DUF3489 domain-containing protein [Magnetococcales bacterium]|nr:DUF3489 domain-containing protein [Magnetococcales bacterium]
MNDLTKTQETILVAATTREDGSIYPMPEHIKGGAVNKVLASLRAKGLITEDDKIPMHVLVVLDPDFKSVRGQYLNRIEAEQKTKEDADAFAAQQGMVWDWQVQANEPPAATALETAEAPSATIDDEPSATAAMALETAEAPIATIDDEPSVTAAMALETAEAPIATIDDEPPATMTFETNNDFETEVIVAEQAIAKAPKVRDNTKKAKVIEMLKRPEGATAAQIAEATGWQGHTIRGFLSIAKKKLGLVITTNRLRIVGPNQQGSPGSFTTYYAK